MQTITVLNKSDRGTASAPFPAGDQGVYRLSVKQGDGVEAFVEGLTASAKILCDVGDAPVITRGIGRHCGIVGTPFAGPRREAAGIDGGGFTSRDAGAGAHYRAV